MYNDHYNMVVFLPTLPARGATFGGASPSPYKAISTHAPREGSDQARGPQKARRQEISTHAPREGSDLSRCLSIDTCERISTHAPREGSDDGYKYRPSFGC